MICPHCQQEHSETTRYCPNTGKEITPPSFNQQGPQKRHSSLGTMAAILFGAAALVTAVVLIVLQLRSAASPAPQGSSPNATAEPMGQQTSRIVYTSNQGGTANIFLYDLEEGSTNQLTNSAGENWSPAWSGDGEKILFTSNRDGNSEIYVMNADGSNQLNLTQNTVEDAFPDMSSDGTRIVFESMRDGNNEIYVMNADGSGQTRLTDHPDLDGLPSWSPDGSRIAFTRAQDGNTDIYVMNADGSGQTQLTNDPANDNSATWSPDGSKIGFDSDRDGQWEFYTMNPDGSNQTRITQNVGYYGYADWAPEREYITYTADNTGDLNIGVMTTSGARVAMLVDSPYMEVESQWSPGYVPGIYADPIIPLTSEASETPGGVQSPAYASTPDQLPTSANTTPVAPGSCSVQNGDWVAWSEDGLLNLIITITDCKFSVMMMMGTFEGQWMIFSHYLDVPITGSDFEFDYTGENGSKYWLSGTFTSATTADMKLLFFGPFKYSDTGMFAEDTLFELTASTGQ